MSHPPGSDPTGRSFIRLGRKQRITSEVVKPTRRFPGAAARTLYWTKGEGCQWTARRRSCTRLTSVCTGLRPERNRSR
jgi:hypothetical protein